MSTEKKIGVIISMNGSPYQGNFIKGFSEKMTSYGYDVLVFSALSKRGMGVRHITGEMNIFSLINYDMLDGIAVLPDTLPCEQKQISEFLDNLYNNFKKPVVCVDYNDERFSVVDTSDYRPYDRRTRML